MLVLRLTAVLGAREGRICLASHLINDSAVVDCNFVRMGGEGQSLKGFGAAAPHHPSPLALQLER